MKKETEMTRLHLHINAKKIIYLTSMGLENTIPEGPVLSHYPLLGIASRVSRIASKVRDYTI